jgi:rusticyanin
MKRINSILFFTLLLGASVFAAAHAPFTMVSNERKTVKETELAALEKDQTLAQKDKTNLTFTEKEIRLVVLTGPEEDMLSYRIQGVRNPNLVIPSGATLRILFVNVDTDMRHDVLFGHVTGDFPVAPETNSMVGSQKLTARTEDGTLQAEEVVIKASQEGAYKYFCSVRGHAKGGMWGNILVGVKPGADLKAAEKNRSRSFAGRR